MHYLQRLKAQKGATCGLVTHTGGITFNEWHSFAGLSVALRELDDDDDHTTIDFILATSITN